MADEAIRPLHHHVSRVMIDDELGKLTPNPAEPTAIIPTRRVRVITVNGEIWENHFWAFGLTKGQVVAHWDAEWFNWKKIESSKS